MKSIFAFVIALAFAPSPASAMDEIPMSPQMKAKCQQTKSALEKCQKDADQIPKECSSTNALLFGAMGGMNKTAHVQQSAQNDAAKEAADTAARCGEAIESCEKKCQKLIDQAQRCAKPEEKQQAKQAGEKLKEYCTSEGGKAKQAAQQQAGANNSAKDDAKENGEKNQGQGGGSPQMPQPPQQKPEEKKQAEEDKKKCTPGTEGCPATAACNEPGGALNPQCQIGSPIPADRGVAGAEEEGEEMALPANIGDITGP